MNTNQSFEMPKPAPEKQESYNDWMNSAFASMESNLKSPPEQEEPEESPLWVYPHSVLEKNEVNFSVSTINMDEDKKSDADEKSEDSVVIENEAELLSAPKNEKEEEFTLFGVNSFTTCHQRVQAETNEMNEVTFKTIRS